MWFGCPYKERSDLSNRTFCDGVQLVEGKYGLVFDMPNELGVAIDRIMSDEKYFPRMSSAARAGSQGVDVKLFGSQLTDTLLTASHQ
jgi:hypothetical protein